MKNLLLSFTIILTSASASAQLFVRPNPTASDSYVYVKSEILYVKGDIELEKNAGTAIPNGVVNTEASIYLREGGQLLQDKNATISTNKGDGFLSVQQISPVNNAWAYNYWCSPVGNPAAGIGVNPTTNVGSSIQGNKNFGINSFYEDMNPTEGVGTLARQSSNVSSKEGFTSPNLTISRRWISRMMEPGVEKAANYVRVNATDGVPSGYGFAMKGVNIGGLPANPNDPSHSQLYEFRGRPNNGEFKITVMGPTVTANTNPPDVAVESAKMTLTGNPYPSALDLNKLFWDNPTVNAIYFYDEDRTKMSHFYNQKPYGYGVWVPGPEDLTANGDPANYPGYYTAASFFIWNAAGNQTGSGSGSSSNDQNKRYAPIGQGFMLVGNGPEDVEQDAYIKNSYRVFRKQGPYSIFQKPENESDHIIASQEDNESNRSGSSFNTAEQLDIRAPQLRLYVVFDDALSRDLLLVFSPQATDGVDRGFDGLSPMGMKSEAYFPIGNDSERKPYAIQGVKFDPTKKIPISFKLHKTTQIEIRAVEEIKKPYEKAYLFDRVENTYRPLESAHSLAGTFTLPAGSYEDRFFIVFRARNTDDSIIQANPNTQPKAIMNVGLFQNNPARQLEISNPEGYTFKSASVYDMSGKLVISEKNLGDRSTYSFYTGNLSDGVYLVKLLTSDDQIIDYKAVVMNR